MDLFVARLLKAPLARIPSPKGSSDSSAKTGRPTVAATDRFLCSSFRITITLLSHARTTGLTKANQGKSNAKLGRFQKGFSKYMNIELWKEKQM